MRKPAILIIAALIFGVLSTVSVAQVQWKKFTPTGEAISVLFPVEPKASMETKDSQNGPYTTHLFSAADQGTFYIFGYTDYDPGFNFGIQAEINANRDNLLKGIKAKLIGETPITVAGNKGIEFTAETDTGMFFTSRVFIIGRRPYQLATATKKGADQTNAKKFLGSFETAAKRTAVK
jgi:hypothetical protein